MCVATTTSWSRPPWLMRGSFFPRATTVERPRGGASSAARRPRSARGPASPRGGAGPPPNPMYLNVFQHPLALALAEVHASGSIDEKKRQSTGNVFHLDCSLFRFEPQKAAPPKFSKYKTNGAFLDFQFFSNILTFNVENRRLLCSKVVVELFLSRP